MKRFVVGYIDWMNNDLKLEIVYAKTWKEALAGHTKYPWKNEPQHAPDTDDIELFQQACFDCDCMMNVIEVG